MNTKQITGIILAGGRSSRMGSDKSLMMLNGKTLAEYAIDTLKPLCSQVIISSNNFSYGFTGCEVWPDLLTERAPMVGIYSCLKKSETEINIILSCDMPLMNTAMLEYLLANSENYDITIPVHDENFMEPLCGIYKKSSIGILKQFIDEGNFRMMECIRHANSMLVPMGPELSFFSPGLFLNVNTPADFKKLLSIFGNGGSTKLADPL